MNRRIIGSREIYEVSGFDLKVIFVNQEDEKIEEKLWYTFNWDIN